MAILVASKLSPRERQALLLKSQGLTRTETARHLGCGSKHVKNLWQSARRKARKNLPPGAFERLSVPDGQRTTIRLVSLPNML